MVTNNQILLILTVPITIGAIVTILSFLATTGVVGGLQGDIRSLSDQVNMQPALDDLIAQLPVAPVQDTIGVNETIVLMEQPEGFTATDQDLISAFLDAIGATVTETFGVRSQVTLIDSDFEQQIEASFIKVQPLDPREVLLPQAPETENLRFFVNTDFSRQLADNGINFHKFSGWDVVNDFGGLASLPIAITTTTVCGTVPNTGLCVNVIGSKNNRDSTANFSVLHGLSKQIDLSDWTREGDLVFNLDYSCNPNFLLGLTKMKINIVSDGTFQDIISCQSGKYTKEISGLIGNSDSVTIQFGAFTQSYDNFRMDFKFNNPQVIGNSKLVRMATEAISLLEGLSIIQNDADQTVLDLGIIEVKLIGETIFDNEKVVLQGDFQTRINGNTISQHQLSASGFSQANQIPINIDGQDSFFFKLDEQFFGVDTFNTLTFVVNNLVVNVGEDDVRSFEYHIPFVVYLLEFNVRPNEIVAFNENDVAISVLKNDSTLITCGTSAGDMNPEVLPPAVSIIANGFTITTTNPEAGKGAIRDVISGEILEDAEFCQTVPNLPRDTELTFKIGNSFFEIFSPVTQSNFFVKCTPLGCSSNIGFGN